MILLSSRLSGRAVAALFIVIGTAVITTAQETRPFEPVSGQPGKDVVWVPTPAVVVEKMLDIAKVTPQDFVIDLGSGDGRNVIAAAKRGARALGVEFNPDMVALSKRRAAEAGVADGAAFVQGDMYEADISKASVMALFLLPENMRKLRPKFLALRPGSRIVSNTFGIEGWEPDYSEVLPDCSEWCTVLLWIVPANVAGSWQTPQGGLTLDQDFQHITGTLGATPIADGRVTGEDVSFAIGAARYTARLRGAMLEGTVTTGGSSTPWRATR